MGNLHKQTANGESASPSNHIGCIPLYKKYKRVTASTYIFWGRTETYGVDVCGNLLGGLYTSSLHINLVLFHPNQLEQYHIFFTVHFEFRCEPKSEDKTTEKVKRKGRWTPLLGWFVFPINYQTTWLFRHLTQLDPCGETRVGTDNTQHPKCYWPRIITVSFPANNYSAQFRHCLFRGKNTRMCWCVLFPPPVLCWSNDQHPVYSDEQNGSWVLWYSSRFQQADMLTVVNRTCCCYTNMLTDSRTGFYAHMLMVVNCTCWCYINLLTVCFRCCTPNWLL